MRIAFVSLVIACAGLATPLSAEVVPVPAEAAIIRHPGLASIVTELEQRAQEPQDAHEAGWISELTGFYRMAEATPLWTDEFGITRRGDALSKEISAADLYGLDARDFALPEESDVPAVAEVKLSLAAVKYIWHAHGGRVNPSQLSLWLDQAPRTVYASTVIRTIASADDVALELRSHHPQHPDFEALRVGLLQARGLMEAPKETEIQPGSRIVQGERHIDIALIRRKLDIPAADERNETLADAEVMWRVSKLVQRYARWKWAIDDDVRAIINKASVKTPADNKAMAEKILINMERWRWVPRDMGELHVWNNLPEFESRIVKNETVIHRERIIIGKPHTQTPVFSDAMSQVVFQPTWGLPPSIKVRQFGGRGNLAGVLEARGMKIIDDTGRVWNPNYINWSKIDISHLPIIQGPGPGNPLGRLKFVFPNSHAVYMHDTPDKHLFNAQSRTFSHGCMRVRNPQQFAEVVLRETRGFTPEDVARNLTFKDTIKVDLPQHIPVHVTYFTVVPDGRGGLKSLADVYGHDKRIGEAMAGVPVARIAARDPARAQQQETQNLARALRGGGGRVYRERLVDESRRRKKRS